MKKASMILDRDFAIGRIDPRLYGSFIEHLGRAVYGGIYEPGHPTADEEGFRRDVHRHGAASSACPSCAIPAATSSPASTGRTASARAAERPSRLDLAWYTTEPNAVGLHEFVDWCEEGRLRGHVRRQPGHPRRARRRSNVVEYAQPSLRHAIGATCARAHGAEAAL